MELLIKDIKHVKELVLLANNKKYADYDIDCQHGRYVIDLKSIMGMLSMDYPKKVELTIRADKKIQDEFYKEVNDIE